MDASSPRWERWLRMPSAAAACLLFWGFAERGGDGLTADVLHTGLAGAWVVPSGLLLAVVLCTSASASRSCLGLGLCVPALGDALSSRLRGRQHTTPSARAACSWLADSSLRSPSSLWSVRGRRGFSSLPASLAGRCSPPRSVCAGGGRWSVPEEPSGDGSRSRPCTCSPPAVTGGRVA